MTTTSCSNCHRYAAVVAEGGTLWLYNLARDGFTGTANRHVCGESDRTSP